MLPQAALASDATLAILSRILEVHVEGHVRHLHLLVPTHTGMEQLPPVWHLAIKPACLGSLQGWRLLCQVIHISLGPCNPF